MFVDVGVQTKLTGEELDKKNQDLRRKKNSPTKTFEKKI